MPVECYQVPLFNENKTTEEEIKALAEIAEFHRLPKGYSLSESGYPIDLFILVRHGELSVKSSGLEKSDTRALHAETRKAKRGDYIGSLSLMLTDVDEGERKLNLERRLQEESLWKIQ